MQIKRIVKVYSQFDDEWTFYEVTNSKLVLPEFIRLKRYTPTQNEEFEKFMNNNLRHFKPIVEDNLIGGVPFLIHGEYYT